MEDYGVQLKLQSLTDNMLAEEAIGVRFFYKIDWKTFLRFEPCLAETITTAKWPFGKTKQINRMTTTRGLF